MQLVCLWQKFIFIFLLYFLFCLYLFVFLKFKSFIGIVSEILPKESQKSCKAKMLIDVMFRYSLSLTSTSYPGRSRPSTRRHVKLVVKPFPFLHFFLDYGKLIGKLAHAQIIPSHKKIGTSK